MKRNPKGNRHPLLLHKRAMGRLLRNTTLAGLIFAGLAWLCDSGTLGPKLVYPYNFAAVAAAVVFFGLAFYALLARGMGYVQAFPDHMRIVTPLLRLKVSYRRFHSVRPDEFSRLYPLAQASKADRYYLKPFYGQTVVAVHLNAYPMNPVSLRVFLPKHMFLPDQPGFAFLVSDWMALSTDLDSYAGNFREGIARPADEDRFSSMFRG